MRNKRREPLRSPGRLARAGDFSSGTLHHRSGGVHAARRDARSRRHRPTPRPARSCRASRRNSAKRKATRPGWRTRSLRNYAKRFHSSETTVERSAMNRLLERISIDPEICGGRPCIKGTRIWVSLILDFLASGMTESQLLAEYPPLVHEDVLAAIAYGAEASRERVVPVPMGGAA